jgi:hypothetical protein
MISAAANLWDDVLLAIEEGRVVPIVGRDLLVVETDKGPCLFHHLIAQALAAELAIATDNLPPQFEPNDVFCAYEDAHHDAPPAINPRVVRILKSLKVPLPESLRLLAEIPNFNLFISTTFDTLLEEAILAVRGQKPIAVAFPAASSRTDFDETLLQKEGSSLVFQILGRASVSAPFAVTEGQILELMHDFMSGPRRPDNLIAKLKESHLLIIGVGFPDWLARFLLRCAREKPLWDSRSIMEVIAESSRPQPDFALFLHHFSPEHSRLFTEGTPVDFVRELHRRWFERNPPVKLAAVNSPSEMEPLDRWTSGSVFISYASEDREAALRLSNELAAAGLEVWIDTRINPGDDYNYIIERHIRECCAMVPVLSRHTQSDEERWFRKEWRLGQNRAQFFTGIDRSFFFPVVVDSTRNDELVEFRRQLFDRSAARALEGRVPTELIQQLDQAQKAWRKQFTRT